MHLFHKCCTGHCIHTSKHWNSARKLWDQLLLASILSPLLHHPPFHWMGKTRKQLNISNLVMEKSSWTWFSVTRGTVIWPNHFSGHFVRRISSIIPLIAMSNAIASWVLSQTKVSASGQKVTFCLHDYFLKHLSSPRCESWLFCL